MNNSQISEQNARLQRRIDEYNLMNDGGICIQCHHAVIAVFPSLSNGWASYQHKDHKWDASHDAKPVNTLWPCEI